MPLTALSRRLALLVLACLAAACVPVTVNITFPQEKLEGAATRIEDMVRSPENPKPPVEPKKTAPQSRLSDGWLAALGARAAEAQVPDIRVQTPQLMKAIESRRNRNAQIEQAKARSCIGETSQGLVEARPGQGCGGEVAGLVAAENADRTFIYDTLMQQNNIPAGDAPRVRAAFAKVNRDRAKPGEWVQQENGQWVKK
jgi:uncharacterized protein YdbL (DUF1318 family)